MDTQKKADKRDTQKVKCSYCAAEMDCPKDMLSAKKHMCSSCFEKNGELLTEEKPGDIQIDIPPEKMDEMVPDIFLQMLDKDVFPEFWKDCKKDLQKLPKKDLAKEAFLTGARVVFDMMNSSREEVDEDDDDMPAFQDFTS